MCTENVANVYLLFLKMPLDLISEHVILKNFLGGHAPRPPLEIACSTCWLSDFPDQGNAMLNCFPTHKNGPPKLQFEDPALIG